MLSEKCIPKHFVKFTENHLWWRSFLFLLNLQAWTCNFIKKGHHCRCFPVNFTNIFKKCFPCNTYDLLFLSILFKEGKSIWEKYRDLTVIPKNYKQNHWNSSQTASIKCLWFQILIRISHFSGLSESEAGTEDVL